MACYYLKGFGESKICEYKNVIPFAATARRLQLLNLKPCNHAGMNEMLILVLLILEQHFQQP